MLRDGNSSPRYACSMRSTPDQDARLRARLQEAVDRFSDGNAEAFAKRIGFSNGGYIRMCLRADNPRPVRESVIDRVHAVDEMRGWFDPVLAPVSAADVRSAARTKDAPWPFKRLTLEQWHQLDDFEANVAEHAYLEALDRLRSRSDAPAARAPREKQQTAGA